MNFIRLFKGEDEAASVGFTCRRSPLQVVQRHFAAAPQILTPAPPCHALSNRPLRAPWRLTPNGRAIRRAFRSNAIFRTGPHKPRIFAGEMFMRLIANSPDYEPRPSSPLCAAFSPLRPVQACGINATSAPSPAVTVYSRWAHLRVFQITSILSRGPNRTLVASDLPAGPLDPAALAAGRGEADF